MELRDYQIKLIEQIRDKIRAGHKKIVMSSPTGSGKTVMFTYMVSNAIQRGGNVIVFTHRRELLKQASSTFNAFNLIPELIKPGVKFNKKSNLHVCMIETFNRRKETLAEFLNNKTLVIIDECHLSSFDKIFPLFNNNQIVIGATATCYRKGKAVKSMEEFYNDIAQEVDTPDLVEHGYLMPARSYGQKIDLKKAKKVGEDFDTKEIYQENKVYKGVVTNYLKICPDTKAIVFASNVDSSKQVCNEFNINGVRAKHIDGETPAFEREEILDWFKNTDNAIVCNCGILNAGYDQPDVKTIILYRATTSLPLFLQMCGRGSRMAEGKTHFNILDFGNNIKRLGFWEDARVWSLKKIVQRDKKEDAMITKDCPECEAILPAKTKKCTHCGFVFPDKKEDENDLIADLEKLEKREILNKAKQEDVNYKVMLVKSGLVKYGAILHSMTDVEEAYEFVRLMGWKKGWLHFNKQRYKVFNNG